MADYNDCQELEHIHKYANGLLTKIKPEERKKLARELAIMLRKSNRQRITAQKNPDGAAFEQKKRKITKKTNRIKNKMFTKLKTAKYLKQKTTPNEATVYFVQSVAKMARIHHYGLRGRILKGKNISTVYPKRAILGLSNSDNKQIEAIVLNYLIK